MPVLLVVRVMGRLVPEGLPVMPFESWDHQALDRSIEHLVSEDPEQFLLQVILVMLSD